MSFGTCSRALRGWLAGCGAATAVIFGCTLVLIAIGSGGDLLRFLGGGVALLFPSLLFFLVTCLLTAVPAAFAIWLSEKFQIRSILFFGCIGAAIGVISLHLLMLYIAPSPPSFGLLFLVPGFAAGVTYWFIAGKYTGAEGHIPSDAA